jgi:hypothetical protein
MMNMAIEKVVSEHEALGTSVDIDKIKEVDTLEVNNLCKCHSSTSAQRRLAEMITGISETICT